ncbi:exodeoxyribonuclease VII large subunit [Paenibacillus thermotolerans]|uniref:exodeoxyribonuclease VII large subunit n=1 Tax=Paenibacillus thermotolerans TaxID=3027807 RepID=UPI003CC68656
MKLESDALLQDIWVRGEISNFTRHSSGHLYFTLKDKDSRIKAVMFAAQASRLPFMPKDGTRVIARGNVAVYERDGQYQFYASSMQPDGIGSLYLAYEQLKRKLEEEGLFAAERKRPIPRFPKAIGVITSPTGAAVRDIIITLQRRYPSIPVLLYPVSVQGTGAAPSIVKAIRTMNERKETDVLIVGRGGGSLEELWAFNEEAVARAIASSVIPVISAVGHETDFTIADFVADLRAATPTAAAELAVPHRLELKQSIRHLSLRLESGLQAQVTRKRERLARLKRSPFLTDPRRQLMLQQTERLDRLTSSLMLKAKARASLSRDRFARLDRRLANASPRDSIRQASRRLDMSKLKLLQLVNAQVKDARHALSVELRRLDALSPLKVMQRGYSLVYNEKKRLVKSIDQVQLGDLVRVQLSDGALDCQVWSMREENGDE